MACDPCEKLRRFTNIKRLAMALSAAEQKDVYIYKITTNDDNTQYDFTTIRPDSNIVDTIHYR